MEKLPEYKAQNITSIGTIYNDNDLRMEEVILKINEIIDFLSNQANESKNYK